MSNLDLIQKLSHANFDSINDYAKNKLIVHHALNQIDSQDAKEKRSLLDIIQPALEQLKEVRKQIQQNQPIDKLPLMERWKSKVNYFFVWIKNIYYRPPKLQALIEKTELIAKSCQIQPDASQQTDKQTREASQISSAKMLESRIKTPLETKQAPNLKEFNQQIDALEKQLKAES